jgi:pSer/pThr/pTyr-binding forkhead associated (FHA) protein
MAYLVVTVRDRELYRRELSGPMTLGRSTDCDLWLNDNGISRRHCRFERGEDGSSWAVQDLGSRNGVFVHGERVAKHILRDGDHVRVGDAKITFHEVGYVSSRPATPQMSSGDSMSDTVVSNGMSRNGRAMPIPRAATPAKTSPDLFEAPAPDPSTPLAFQRPPARPMPVGEKSIDDTDPEQPPHPREGLFRRFLHK